MLDDLLTSSRGPGLIGTILALVVLCGFGGLAFLVLEDESGGKSVAWQIKKRKAALVELGNTQEKIREVVAEHNDKRKVIEKIAKLQEQIKRKQTEVKYSEEELASLQAKFAEAEERFDDYRKRYTLNERARAVGETMDSLTIGNGKTYTDVLIRRVSSEGIDIRHKNGGTLIVHNLLPKEFKDRFQYTKDDAAQAEAAMQRRLAQSKKGKDAYEKSVKVQAVQTKVLHHKSEISRINRSITKAKSNIRSYSIAAQRAAAKASENRRKHSAAISAGRRSSWSALARQEEKKAAKYQEAVGQLRQHIRKKEALVAKHNTAIAGLEKEKRALLNSK